MGDDKPQKRWTRSGGSDNGCPSVIEDDNRERKASHGRQDVVLPVLLESQFMSAFLTFLINFAVLVTWGRTEAAEFIHAQDERPFEGCAHLDLPAAEKLATHGSLLSLLS